jgi:hypothetical protein
LLGLLRLPDIIRDASRLANIPKSTLLAITRIGDEAEQLAAFEAAKSGVVSVRAANSHAERPQDNVNKATSAIYAVIDRLGQVEGVPDKKALVALKEAKRKLDELYREITGRKATKAT